MAERTAELVEHAVPTKEIDKNVLSRILISKTREIHIKAERYRGADYLDIRKYQISIGEGQYEGYLKQGLALPFETVGKLLEEVGKVWSVLDLADFKRIVDVLHKRIVEVEKADKEG